MKVVALVSGGKDSCFSMMECIRYGHEIIAVANLLPPVETNSINSEEMDSHMFQTVGHSVVSCYGECLGIPLIRETIRGASVSTALDYELDPRDEVEDLYRLLKRVTLEHPEVQAVCSGAILSDYQRLRVENVCSRLGLTSLAYLWRRDQHELMRNMIDGGVEAVLIKTAALGLGKEHLGLSLSSALPSLVTLEQKWGINVAGEGGEFESLTLDCPLFRKRIVLDETRVLVEEGDPYAPVSHMIVTKFHLELKT